MSEETATPAASAGTTGTRRATSSTSRRRGPVKSAEHGGPALPPERDDPYQAFRRIWPD